MQKRERALVMLRLETEVALDHDDYLAQGELAHLAETADVALDERKLLLRLCGRKRRISDTAARQRQGGRRSFGDPRWVIGGSPIFGRHPWIPAEN